MMRLPPALQTMRAVGHIGNEERTVKRLIGDGKTEAAIGKRHFPADQSGQKAFIHHWRRNQTELRLLRHALSNAAARVAIIISNNITELFG